MRSKKKSKINKKLTRRQRGGNKKILTIELSEGLGNRIFKILAGLGFAEKWNMDFCIVKSKIIDNDHIKLEESINHIKTLFPNVPILDISSNFPIEYREKERYIYEDFPKPNDNTILYGTFQSEKYFPDKLNINVLIPKNSILENVNKENLYFIHFRLDDYLNYSETNLNLINYYKHCINEIKSLNSNVSFLILTKNIDDAKKYIADNLSLILDINTLIFDTNTSRLDSLYYMSQCKGAIISNSTFSWIGAYLSHKEKVYFPSPWMSSLIKDKHYDIYPDWATLVDIDIKTGGKKSMKAYVINLDNRPEKWERIQNDFKDTDIEVERFAAIKHDNGHIGCGLTHVALVKMAKEKSLDSILIIEDDCKLTKNFNNRWATIKKYLDENKDNWDIFNGGVVWPTNPTLVANLEPDIKLIQSNGPGCRYAHFVYINKSGYDKAIEWEPMVLEAIKDGEPFVDPKYDSWINEFPRFRNVLMSEGAIAVQYSGLSNTNLVNKNLNSYQSQQESMIIGGDSCNIHFFTVSTTDAPELKRLTRSAEIKGWKVDVLGKEQNRKDLGWEDENKEKGIKGNNYGDFSLKLNGLNDFMKDKKDDDIVLWTDAWDVVALDSCQRMYDKYVKFNKPIVFSAEKACSPDASKRDLYDTLDTKFPFLCAGMFIGKVKELKYLMTFYKGEKMNDQVFWTDMYLKNKNIIAIDNNAEMFLSTWDTDGKYYNFDNGVFTYTETNTSPVFIHANGNNKDKLLLFENYFNLAIQKGYVVNLEERKSKWDKIQEDFKNTNFFLERFNAIKDEVGHKGCGKSYQAIIKMAKENNMDSIFIFDDDCKPLDNFNERWIKAKKWLDANNDKWEIFNGGLKLVTSSVTKLIDTIDENNKILSIHEGIHTQMVLYKKEAYDRMLEWDYDKNWLIDFKYINTNKFKTVFIEPPLASQKEGFSDTEGYHKPQTGGKRKTLKRKRTYKKQSGGGEKLHYITVSTKDTPELQRLIKSAKKYDLNIDVLGLELNRNNGGHKQPLNDNLKGGKFGVKLRYPKEYLQDKNPDDILLFTDAWDVVVANNPNTLLDKYKKFNKDIVFSAENALWPDVSREANYVNSKDEPFPFINSGGYIGKIGVIRDLLNNYNGEDIDDQRFWTDIYFKNRDKIVLDTKAEIFLSMHAINHEDLLFDNNVFTYKETNTQPIIAHGNGMSKDLIKIFTDKLQIGGKRKHNKTKKKKMKGGSLNDIKLESNLSKEELSNKMKKYNVIFGGTARNVGPHIKNALENIEKCGNRFNKFQVIIYENDSSDDTRKIMNDNKKDNYHYIFEDNITEARRTFRLANGRQKLLDKAKELNKDGEYDFYILLDLDERIESGSYVDTIETCFINENWDVLCGNQLNEYYDIWALRRKGEFDYDFLNEPEKHKSFSGRLKYEPGMLLEVDAAFGGIAIYRMKSLDDECKYTGDYGDGREQCEHVPFTKCLKSKGRKIYINTSFLTNVPKSSGGNRIKNIASHNSGNLAIMILGQIRTFFTKNVNDTFKKVIDRCKLHYNSIYIVLIISGQYDKTQVNNWFSSLELPYIIIEYDPYIDEFKKRNLERLTNENYIRNKEIYINGKTGAQKNTPDPIYNGSFYTHNSSRLTSYEDPFSYIKQFHQVEIGIKHLLEYEKTNNMKFDVIMKSRFDYSFTIDDEFYPHIPKDDIMSKITFDSSKYIEPYLTAKMKELNITNINAFIAYLKTKKIVPPEWLVPRDIEQVSFGGMLLVNYMSLENIVNGSNDILYMTNDWMYFGKRDVFVKLKDLFTDFAVLQSDLNQNDIQVFFCPESQLMVYCFDKKINCLMYGGGNNLNTLIR
jgi:GR25 family glycosyltransferase involved in LPS biosynthesis